MNEDLVHELGEIRDLCRQILADHETHDYRRLGEFDPRAWDSLGKAGLTDLASGFDGDDPAIGMHRALTVLRESGRHPVGLPLSEHDLLARWVSDQTGLAFAGTELRTVAVVDENGAGNASWLDVVDQVVVVAPAPSGGSLVWVVDVAEVFAPSATGGEESLRSVRVMQGATKVIETDGDLRPGLTRLAAVARTVMMAGAAERAVELVVEHVTTREQFGRPIARFQAVQHAAAELASEAALISAVADSAAAVVAELGPGDPATEFAVAAAVSCAGHAAALVVRNSHQLLGAMGYSQEHQLRIFTNRLVRWRSEYGSVSSWDSRVLEAAVSAGDRGLWPLVAGQPMTVDA